MTEMLEERDDDGNGLVHYFAAVDGDQLIQILVQEGGVDPNLETVGE